MPVDSVLLEIRRVCVVAIDSIAFTRTRRRGVRLAIPRLRLRAKRYCYNRLWRFGDERGPAQLIGARISCVRCIVGVRGGLFRSDFVILRSLRLWVCAVAVDD